jgi:hypothetical protein
MASEIASEDLTIYAWTGDPNDCVMHTIELRHPAFRDEDGNTAPVRIVCDFEELAAMLEDGAPIDGGDEVTFSPCAFSVKLPDQGMGGSPFVNVNIDNVSRTLMPYADAAADSPSPVDMTYRQFLASNLSAPALVMDGAKINKLKINLFGLTGQAGYDDFINKPHPALIYTTREYPGLDR